jgi:hypothetical protein
MYKKKQGSGSIWMKEAGATDDGDGNSRRRLANGGGMELGHERTML